MPLDGCLSFDHGRVSVGGVVLPGLLKGCNVSCDVEFDEAGKDGLSGKKKTPKGWDDAAVTIDLWLTTEPGSTCYDKLKTINGLFKGTDKGANPMVLTVINAHVQARGIRQLIFSGLRSSETENSDEITATLAFKEHNPPVVASEKRVAASDKAKGGAGAPAAKPAAGAEKSILVDVG